MIIGSFEPNGRDALAGLLGTPDGPIQNHARTQPGGELVRVLGKQRQRHIVESRRGMDPKSAAETHVDHHEVLMLSKPGLQDLWRSAVTAEAAALGVQRAGSTCSAPRGTRVCPYI